MLKIINEDGAKLEVICFKVESMLRNISSNFVIIKLYNNLIAFLYRLNHVKEIQSTLSRAYCLCLNKEYVFPSIVNYLSPLSLGSDCKYQWYQTHLLQWIKLIDVGNLCSMFIVSLAFLDTVMIKL
jgi:hypothetical protein